MHYITNISPLIKDIELRQDPVIITVNDFTEEAAKKFQDQMCVAQNSGQKVIPIEIENSKVSLIQYDKNKDCKLLFINR